MSRWMIEKSGTGIEKAGTGIEKAGTGIEKSGTGIEKSGTGIEKSDIKGFLRVVFRQVNGIHILLAVVIVITIAGKPSQQDPFIRIMPAVKGQHNKSPVDGPGIGQGGDKRGIDHVPFLPVILLFLV